MPTAADILIDTLIDWKVDIIFGLPGDGVNGIMEALRTRQDRIRFIQVQGAAGDSRAHKDRGECRGRAAEVDDRSWRMSRRHRQLQKDQRGPVWPPRKTTT